MTMTKHKKTIAPWECSHCGVIWYGTRGGSEILPAGVLLCIACWNALDGYLYRQHQNLYHQRHQPQVHPALQAQVTRWVADKSVKPYPRPVARRFSGSVPKWMRSAIDAGMVKTNGTEVYIVYSEAQQAIRADTNLHSKKSF